MTKFFSFFLLVGVFFFVVVLLCLFVVAWPYIFAGKSLHFSLDCKSYN